MFPHQPLVLRELFLLLQLCSDFPVQFEGPHVISDRQVWVGVVTKGCDGTPLNSSYRNRQAHTHTHTHTHTTHTQKDTVFPVFDIVLVRRVIHFNL